MIRIRSGEYCDSLCLSVETIPDITILLDSNSALADTKEYVARNRKGFATLLSEVYQILKGNFSDRFLLQNVSFELLLVSYAVENQTYRAEVKPYIVLRCIDYDSGVMYDRLNNLKNIFVASLISLKYSVKDVTGEIYPYLSADGLKKVAILKEDTIANLQNYFKNECYAFDKFPEADNDFSMLVDFLSQTPEALVSVQLIPTFYSREEKFFIERTSTILDTLKSGIRDAALGNVTDPIADRYSQKYKYYERNKDAALYSYNILAMAKGEDIATLTAKLCGQIDSGGPEEGHISLRTISLNGYSVDFNTCFNSLPWILNDLIMDKLYSDYPLYHNEGFDYRRLMNVITSDEAAQIFCLPIGSKYVNRGLKIDFSQKDAKLFTRNIVNCGDFEVGRLKSSFGNNTIGFTLKDLNKHMLIVGVPGMGKTTYSIGLLYTLWKKHNIPFLVIEPAKTEYRALLKSIPELQLFTFGREDVAPMPINPFVPPDGVRIRQYKSVLKTAFSAGVSMAESLTKLFEETLDEVYSDFEWLDSDEGGKSRGKRFNIRDFSLCFKKTFERHGYVGEAKNVGTAGLLRLVSMTNLFDNYYSVPVGDMLSKPTVIELAAIHNKTEKSFLMALLLLNIASYIDSNYLEEGKLRNVVLIEEAHNLLATTDSNEEGVAKPNAIAQELIKNMLAEKRAQGLGIVIADQSPEKVGSDVIKLTNIKLGFNLAEKSDKDIFANSTNMDSQQIERMTQLVEGEAFFFMGGMSKPEEVVIPDNRANLDIDITISNDAVRKMCSYWDGQEYRLKPYPDCFKNKYCGNKCYLREREIACNVARKILNKFFNENTADITLLNRVLSGLAGECRAILSEDIPLTKRLFLCIKVQLLRNVRYSTKIKTEQEYIDRVLSD